jgi:hypothetical protein
MSNIKNNQKIIAEVALIILVALGVCLVWIKQVNNTKSDNATTSQVNTSTWKTYTNSQYGFEIGYPAIIKFQDPTECSNVVGEIGCFYYAPGKTAKYSTFSDAVLNINIDSSIKNDLECNIEILDYSGKPLPRKNVNINGIIFSETEMVDAATGLRTAIYFYSTFYKGFCFKFPININYGRNDYSVSNSEYQLIEDETKTDIDLAQKVLSQSLSTFKFTK